MGVSEPSGASSPLASHALRLIVILSLAHPACASASQQDEHIRLDCGVNALYILLNLEGRAVALERLVSALPPRRPDGYSMAELAAASQSLGLHLDGVRFAKGDEALDRPAIAFFKDARGGHFAVLRPVGTTGTMAQVIDPPHVPWITDYDRLLVTRPWMGRILLPREPWTRRYALPLILAGAAIMVASVALRRRDSSRKENATAATVPS
jgi:Peptidase C39 family